MPDEVLQAQADSALETAEVPPSDSEFEATPDDLDAMQIVDRLADAYDEDGSAGVEEGGETDGGTDQVPDGFELTDESIDQMPAKMRPWARVLLQKEGEITAIADRIGPGYDEQLGDGEVEEPQGTEYQIDLPEEFAELRSPIHELANDLNERIARLEQGHVEINRTSAVTQAKGNLQQFRSDKLSQFSEVQATAIEKRMIAESEDAPELLQSYKGLVKLFRLANEAGAERQVTRSRQELRAERRSGPVRRYRAASASAKRTAAVPRIETLDDAAGYASRQLRSKGYRLPR